MPPSSSTPLGEHAGKRWLARATLGPAGRYRAHAPAPEQVGDLDTLLLRLQDEIVRWIQVVLSRFINHPDIIIAGGGLIGEDLIYLAYPQVLTVRVVNADRKSPPGSRHSQPQCGSVNAYSLPSNPPK